MIKRTRPATWLTFIGVLWLFASQAGLFAQNRDVILRADTGKKMTVDKVISESYIEVKYKRGAQERALTSDKVTSITYYDVPDAYTNGLDYLQKGEYENALNSFQLAMEKKSVRSWIKTYSLFQIAKTNQQWGLSNKDKFQDAIDAFNKLLEQDPQTRFYPEVLFRLASCHAANGDLANAQKAFDKLAQEAYDKKLGVIWEAKAKYEKALAQLNGGSHDEAERSFRSAMTFATEQAKDAKNEENPVLKAELGQIASLARLMQGTVMIKKNKIREARQFFEAIINDASSGRDAKAGAECGLGECLMAEKKYKEAQLQFARAKVLYYDIEEEGAKATYYLGELCLLLKNEEPNHKMRARNYFMEVVDAYPGTSWAEKARAKIE
jgi:tetratricopeptide (TPR) repeat protein